MIAFVQTKQRTASAALPNHVTGEALQFFPDCSPSISRHCYRQPTKTPLSRLILPKGFHVPFEAIDALANPKSPQKWFISANDRHLQQGTDKVVLIIDHADIVIEFDTLIPFFFGNVRDKYRSAIAKGRRALMQLAAVSATKGKNVLIIFSSAY